MHRYPGDLYPLHRDALKVVRLANAVEGRKGNGMRYIIVRNIFEAMVDDLPVVILDCEDETHLSVTELLSRLPVDLRNRAL